MNRLKDLNITGIWGCLFLIVITFLLFFVAISSGQVDIPLQEILYALTGSGDDNVKTIVLEVRLPMAITAVLAGALLSVAGLLLQTIFRNPLAGPSLLGVSSGASLGVAMIMMGGFVGFSSVYSDTGSWLWIMGGAVVGALVVIAVLLSFSSILRNGVMLLIVGVMISYLASSVISLLSYFAISDTLKSYTVWGLGSYSAVTLSQIPIFALTSIILCICSLGCIKALNAFLLGERYAASLGYNVRRTRSAILVLSGLLTAVVTAYCGPIGFIGLIVPHIVRMIFRTSNHIIVLPASLFVGATVSLICVILSNGVICNNMLPINVVTPIIGVPIICYIILRRNSLPYFK